MKIIARSFLVLLVTVSSASADWVLVQKTASDGQEKEMITKIKGEQARVDEGKEISILLDSAGMTLLVHASKVVMKADPATMKSLLAAASKKNGAAQQGTAKARPASTGQKEKVGEWDTEIYTWEGTTGQSRFWVTKAIPKSEEINALIDKLGQAMGNPMAGLVPLASDFDGMAVKSEMTLRGKKMTTLLVSVKEQDVDAKEFLAPQGYTTMPVPKAP